MPEVSRFLGIVVYLNINEHNLPHFHAKYGDFQVSIDIETGIIKGEFPKRALRLLLEWYDIHKDELMQNWDHLQNGEQIVKIAPLE
jgi:hypothetical protein